MGFGALCMLGCSSNREPNATVTRRALATYAVYWATNCIRFGDYAGANSRAVTELLINFVHEGAKGCTASERALASTWIHRH